MKTKTAFILFAALLFCSLMITQLGCKKDENNDNGGFATVTTATITNITQTTATSGGNVIDDGISAVTVRGVCWSTNQNPTLNDDYTTNGSGTGPFTSKIIGLSKNTSYYVRAYATNSKGSAYGNQETFTTQIGGEDCPATFTYQGQVYKAVLIGNQCWMAENLNIGEMINGKLDMTNNGVVEKYCYSNDPGNCEIYGGLYQWSEMMEYNTIAGVQGICPSGWHIPTDDEWKILEGTVDSRYFVGDPIWNETGFIGYDAGEKLKSATGWDSGGNGTNDFGFNALPGGYRNTDGNFGELNRGALFWPSSEFSSSTAWYRYLYYKSSKVYRNELNKVRGRSVRCLQGSGCQLSIVTTATITNVTYSTATSGGNVSDDGGSAVTARGVCWSTNQNPTLNDDYTTDGSGTGTFTSEITGLVSITGYYVRAYSTNSEGTAYGNQETFTTQSGGGGGEPCPGIPTITYEGQVYNTVIIGEQCWLKENLNVGTMINGNQNMSNNGVIEKYCYDNNTANCDEYGGLYQWNEMMQYTATQGVQGICPSGWHLPSDDEWKILEGTVDSQYPVGASEWDDTGHRGYDAGINLRFTSGWNSGGNGRDLFGFTALPGGNNNWDGDFGGLTTYASFGSSSEYSLSLSWKRSLFYLYDEVFRGHYGYKVDGRSVRCLQD